MSNHRSKEAEEYRKLYKSKLWQTIRRERLQLDNWTCRYCLAQDRVGMAEVVDHITPHKGDGELFFNLDNTQALCKWHHDSAKRQIETFGYSLEVGIDGLPIDPNHPFNKPRR